MRNEDSTAPEGSGDNETAMREQRLREDREADILLRLASRHAMRSLDAEDQVNAPFFEWMAREARECQRPEDRRATRAAGESFAQRVVAKRAAGRSAALAVDGEPTLLPSPLEGPLALVIDAAARERCAPLVDLAVAAGVGRDLWEEPTTACVQLPESVSDGRFVALRVAGDSMLPFLHAGDVILVKLGDELHSDAIIVARHPDDGYVVKRIGALRAREVELHSLNPRYAPITIPRDGALVLGTVMLRWCTHAGRSV